MNIHTRSILIVVFIFTLLFLLKRPHYSSTMTNENYILKGTFNESPPSPPNKAVEGAQNASFEVETDPSSFFTFTVSSDVIDYGPLSPTNPIMRTLDFKLSSNKGQSTSLYSYEDHPLRADSSQTIPDTTCDNGSCSEEHSSVWQNPLTYGLGYRCDQMDKTPCSFDFLNKDAFKQFPNQEKNITVDPIISKNYAQELLGEISYKLNISGTQGFNSYHNKVTFIATPSF